MYKINNKNHTCSKKSLSTDFHPLEIPQDASLLGQSVLGSSSGPLQGVLVNTWVGELQAKKETGTKRGKGKCKSCNVMWFGLTHDFIVLCHRTCISCFSGRAASAFHVIHFCLHSEVHEHGHGVWMHSHLHSVSYRQDWMGGDQVRYMTTHTTNNHVHTDLSHEEGLSFKVKIGYSNSVVLNLFLMMYPL